VIVTSKDGNKNLLRTVVWKELRLLDGIIQNMTVYHDYEYFTYKDICAKWMSECFQNDILNLDYIMDDVSMNTLNFHAHTKSRSSKMHRRFLAGSQVAPPFPFHWLIVLFPTMYTVTQLSVINKPT
jgi:hypothetical protein